MFLVGTLSQALSFPHDGSDLYEKELFPIIFRIGIISGDEKSDDPTGLDPMQLRYHPKSNSLHSHHIRMRSGCDLERNSPFDRQCWTIPILPTFDVVQEQTV